MMAASRAPAGRGSAAHTASIEFLRHLHDHPATTFGLLLIGGDGCWDVLAREPMLRSRIYRRVSFAPMTAGQVLDVVRRFHSVYADASDELILFVDDNFAHGNFRNWAASTRTAQSLCARGERGFDEDVARNHPPAQHGTPSPYQT